MSDTEDMTTTSNTPRPNRYAASCARCGGEVPAGAGRLVARNRGGRWTVIHTTGVCGRTGNLVVASSANRIPAPVDRYVGRTWAEVMDANEYFDGEPEITAAAHQAWVNANAAAELAGTPAARYLDTTTPWGDPNEAVMHAMEAEYDRRHP